MQHVSVCLASSSFSLYRGGGHPEPSKLTIPSCLRNERHRGPSGSGRKDSGGAQYSTTHAQQWIGTVLGDIPLHDGRQVLDGPPADSHSVHLCEDGQIARSGFSTKTKRVKLVLSSLNHDREVPVGEQKVIRLHFPREWHCSCGYASLVLPFTADRPMRGRSAHILSASRPSITKCSTQTAPDLPMCVYLQLSTQLIALPSTQLRACGQFALFSATFVFCALILQFIGTQLHKKLASDKHSLSGTQLLPPLRRPPTAHFTARVVRRLMSVGRGIGHAMTAVDSEVEAGELSAAELALTDLPSGEMECWRPTTGLNPHKGARHEKCRYIRFVFFA